MNSLTVHIELELEQRQRKEEGCIAWVTVHNESRRNALTGLLMNDLVEVFCKLKANEGLRAVAMCPIRVVLLHYAPTGETLEGEPPGIWAFLGSDRLAAPIAEHEPDLVLHGHAHSGTFEGRIGEVPVYNVSVPVIGRDFWLFELDVTARARTPIH